VVCNPLREPALRATADDGLSAARPDYPGGSMPTLMYIDAASMSLAIQFLVVVAIVVPRG
jgi:hypothetical protein